MKLCGCDVGERPAAVARRRATCDIAGSARKRTMSAVSPTPLRLHLARGIDRRHARVERRERAQRA